MIGVAVRENQVLELVRHGLGPGAKLTAYHEFTDGAFRVRGTPTSAKTIGDCALAVFTAELTRRPPELSVLDLKASAN